MEDHLELETCTHLDVYIWVLCGTHRSVKDVTNFGNKAHPFGLLNYISLEVSRYIY